MLLINTVSINNQEFSKRQINGSEQAKSLYTKIGYTLVKYFRWIIQSKKIIDFPMTVQDIDIAQKIWDQKHYSFKGKDK